VGSGDHRMRALQLPYGIAMGEGGILPTQLGPDGLSRSVLGSLTSTGTAVFASAPLYGGRLVGHIPSWVRAAFPETQTQAQCALQFARSTRNISSAVVGMLDDDHVAENLWLGDIPRADPDLPEQLFRAVQARAAGDPGQMR
jgi:predicted aldo/keto reductase-like oxidoreductase